jgi:integrase
LIFGIAGACRRKELCDLTVNDIQDTGEVLIVTLRDTKTHLDRKFSIIGEGFVVNPLTIYRKYASLRPVNTSHDRFFLFYNNGKCTRQPVGINTFGQLPSKIAAYLTLEDPKTYTGHCFRRSSATLLAAGGGDLVSLKRHGGWRSSTVAEGYIEDCVEERIKIARKVFGGTTTTTTELSRSDTSSSSSSTNGVQYFHKCEFHFHTNEKNEN